MDRVRTFVASGLIASAVVGAGCSGADSVSSTPSETTTLALATAPTTPPPTTVAPTTAAPTTTAPTTPPPTTVPLTSSPPPTAASTTAPASTVPPATVPVPSTAVALVGSALLEVDVASGDVTRMVSEFFDGDGIFRSGLRLMPDRSSAYFSESYEDAWFDCTTSVGATGRVDLATGDVTMLADGIDVELDDDASHTVHLASEVCEPDPAAPDMWVLTPYDRVVVTDLASGDTATYVTDTRPADHASPSAIEWADLAPDGSLLVSTVLGDVHRIPPGATGAIQEFPSVATLDVETLPVEILDDSTLLAAVYGAEGSTDLITIDLADGTRRPLASSETSMAIGVSPDGAVIVASGTPVAVNDGAPVTVLDAFPDDNVLEIDW